MYRVDKLLSYVLFSKTRHVKNTWKWQCETWLDEVTKACPMTFRLVFFNKKKFMAVIIYY